MSEANPVIIPLLNTNEPEALLAGLHISEGQQVNQGDILCTLETTKSSAEVEAESDGYVVGVAYSQGQTVRAGETLCYLADSPDWKPAQNKLATVTSETTDEIPNGLRITAPALAFAKEQTLDLASLPIGPLLTEKAVRDLLDGLAAKPNLSAPEDPYDPKAIVVYGGSGHGKSVINLLRELGTYDIHGVIDDGMQKKSPVMDLSILGGSEVLADLFSQKIRLAVNAVGGIGDNKIREKVFNNLATARFFSPTVIHPTAFVEPSASLSPGVQVFPHAYIGSDAVVEFGCIINTAAIISHDCTLEEYVNISPGAILAGGVQVGARSLIGMGVTINLNVNIGPGVRIGNGATVKSDVPEKGLVRAGMIWPK
ncbi:MAG: hypothetical protein FVQ83_01465 [Chloroflexi bacterium]|nr:hypothetical protein [Chloroflexota bacterium]